MTFFAQTLNFRSEATAQDIPYATSTIGGAIGGILAAVMAIGVLAAFLLIVTAAIEWIISGGEKSKIEAARNKITGSIIGLVILASVFVIIIIVQNFLKIEVFTFPNSSPKTGNFI